MKMSKIIILIPYFGRWPFWMNAFLASCAENPTVDWLLTGDCGEPENLPPNVSYTEISFESYKQRVAQALGIPFDPSDAYKLCDIKPMLGKIHEAEIMDYDFWAFGDLDLVYGNLRAVYTEPFLTRYDLISNHATRVSGHLCLIRNTAAMREVYQKVPGWQERIANPQHVAFDEKAFSKLFVKHKNFPRWLRQLTNRLYPLVRCSSFVERYTTPNGYIAWKDGSYDFPQQWYWKGGQLWNDLESADDCRYPYFHFLGWKKNWSKKDVDPRNGLTFTKAGIHETL